MTIMKRIIKNCSNFLGNFFLIYITNLNANETILFISWKLKREIGLDCCLYNQNDAKSFTDYSIWNNFKLLFLYNKNLIYFNTHSYCSCNYTAFMRI